MSNFHSNLALLQKKNPFLAFFSLQNQHTKVPKLIKQDCSWISNYLSDSIETIIILGSCTDDIYVRIYPWLEEKSSHCVIFLEDNLSYWMAFLHCRISGEVLRNSQIITLFNHSGNYQELIPIGWKIVSKKFIIAVSPTINNQENKKKQILEILESMRLIFAELKDFEVTSLRNIYYNYLSDSEHGNYIDMKDSFRGVPAIICGSGNSLYQSYSSIRNNFSKSLIIAGGRCIKLLQSMSVPVHMGVALCPYVHWGDFTSTGTSTIPLLYSGRLNFKAQIWHHGMSRLIVRGSPYHIEDWLYNQNGSVLPNLDIGWDVICFATHLAYHFGCDPIIFIGVDHAKAYASDRKEKEHGNEIHCLNIEGKYVVSQKDWIISSSWLNEFVKQNPDRAYIHINDKGLLIPNMETVSYSRMNSILTNNTRSYDIENRLYAILQRTKRQDFVYNESIAKLHQLYKSMHRLSIHCKNYLDAFAKRDDRKRLLEQIEMESEKSFSLLFEPLWEVYKKIILPIEISYSIEEIILYRTLFIQRALEVHKTCIQEVLCYRNTTG